MSIFTKYEINDNHKLYFDIYQNRFYAEDDGSSSQAHYSDYWFGPTDSDNCNAGDSCWSTMTHLAITIDNPFLTQQRLKIKEAFLVWVKIQINKQTSLIFHLTKISISK